MFQFSATVHSTYRNHLCVAIRCCIYACWNNMCFPLSFISLCVISSFAMEKIISEDSSDTSCNSPLVWMRVKHLDRTDRKLKKVQSLSHQNHIAINNMKGKIAIDEITEIKNLLKSIQKKMRDMQFEIYNLKRSKYHCHKRLCYITKLEII